MDEPVIFAPQSFFIAASFFLITFVTLLSLRGLAQTVVGNQQDSSIGQLPRIDTIRYAAPAATISSDSVSKRPDTVGKSWDIIDTLPLESQVLARHPYYDFRSRPRLLVSGKKVFRGKELLFYVTVALVMFFALLKLAFAKYFNDLFKVFFRTTMKQRQIKEQLMQTPLPSLAFNIFFVASAGLYLNYQLQYFNLAPVENFWSEPPFRTPDPGWPDDGVAGVVPDGLFGSADDSFDIALARPPPAEPIESEER